MDRLQQFPGSKRITEGACIEVQPLDAPQLMEHLRARFQDLRLPSGEAIIDHCEGTNRILDSLGSSLEAHTLIWLALAAGIVDKLEIEQLAGNGRLASVLALRSLLFMQSVPVEGGKRDLAEQELLRRMFLAMSADVQVVLVRLSSRLQSLRHHAHAKTRPSLEQSRFTLRVLAPLANRLGLGQLKWEMEDLAFRFSDEAAYQRIAKALDEKRSQREVFIQGLTKEVGLGLQAVGLAARVSGRPKHIYSIHNKMLAKQVPIERLLDLRAIRIVVKTVDQCYAALDWIHKRFSPLLAEYDDYIARPKPNGYRSLHTVVLHDDARPVEIQIRTESMHVEAELGFASHWHYKETSTGLSKSKGKDSDQDRIDYVRQLLAWKQDLSHESQANENAAKAIYVLTPQGKVMELPNGSTPIDFAYLLHTELGHRCRGAKINGAMVPLNTCLRSGQTVEIVAARSSDQLGPSRDWLNPNLRYLGSPRARTKVRQWFHALDEQGDLSIGRAKLEKLLQREGKTALAHDELAGRLGMDDVKAMFLAIAREELSARAIETAIRFDEDRELLRDTAPTAPPAARPGKSNAKLKTAHAAQSLVVVNGVPSLLSHLAGCCRPIPPDDIIGFVTRGEGVSVHRVACTTFGRLLARHPERSISVSWGMQEPGSISTEAVVESPARKDSLAPMFAAELMIRANDRSGFLRDLTDLLARHKLRMTAVRSHTKREQLSIRIKLELSHQKELAFAIKMLRQIPGVVLISRVGD